MERQNSITLPSPNPCIYASSAWKRLQKIFFAKSVRQGTGRCYFNPIVKYFKLRWYFSGVVVMYYGIYVASRKPTGFHNFRSIRFFDVMVAKVVFSTAILSSTLFVALMSEHYPYSLFSRRSTRSRPLYLATLINTLFPSAKR